MTDQSTAGYTVTVARSVEEVERLRDQWQQLAEHVNVDIDYFLLDHYHQTLDEIF